VSLATRAAAQSPSALSPEHRCQRFDNATSNTIPSTLYGKGLTHFHSTKTVLQIAHNFCIGRFLEQPLDGKSSQAFRGGCMAY